MPVSSLGRTRFGAIWAHVHRDLGIWPPSSLAHFRFGVEATLATFRSLAFVHRRRALPIAAMLAYRMISGRWFEPITHLVALYVLDDLLLDEGRTIIIRPRRQWDILVRMIRSGELPERDFVRWVARHAPRAT